MPSLRLEYQLSPNAPARDGTRAVRLRIYAGQPPAFITVTRCAPADFIQARKGRLAEVRGNRPKTNLMRARLIRAYDDEEKKRIKAKILRDHNKYSGDFKTRLQSQTEAYLEKNAGSEVDDDYEYFIRAVLLYHFEQCLLGKKAA